MEPAVVPAGWMPTTEELHVDASTPTTPAGWFPDPWGSPEERWWDGTTWTSTTRATRPAPLGRQPMWTSQKVLIGVILVALVIGAYGAFQLGRSAIGAITGESVATPSVIERELDAGRYTIFERVGTQRSAGPVTFSESGATSLGPQDIEVTGPDGDSVLVEIWSIDESLQRGDTLFAGAAGFTAERSGRYTVDIAGPATEVVLARRLFDGTSSALIALGIGAVSGCIAVVALIATVLVRSSRRRALG